MLTTVSDNYFYISIEIQIIEEIFGIKGLNKDSVDQLIIIDDPYQFANVQSYP